MKLCLWLQKSGFNSFESMFFDYTCINDEIAVRTIKSKVISVILVSKHSQAFSSTLIFVT